MQYFNNINKVIEWRDYFSREHKLFLVCRNSQHFLNIITENHFKLKISSEIQGPDLDVKIDDGQRIFAERNCN